MNRLSRLLGLSSLLVSFIATTVLAAVIQPPAIGVDPNNIGYDVILLAGQSNMVGAGTPSPDTNSDPPDPRILVWNAYGYTGQTVVATETTLHALPTAGHALTFARKYVKTLPSNRSVLLVEAAVGGTGFASGYWAAGTPGGLGYENAIAYVNAAMASSRNTKLALILWHQGEADCASMTQSQYQTAFWGLIDGFRTRITGASATTPFILGEMAPEYITNNSCSQIAAAHAATSTNRAYTGYWVGQAGYTIGDNTHYNAPAQRTNGIAAYDAYVFAKSNTTMTANPSAPAVPSSVAVAVTATTATISFAAPTDKSVFDYQIQYRLTSGPGPWIIFQHERYLGSETITGLMGNTSYDFKVAAVNVSGPGTFSSIITQVTPAAGVVDEMQTAVAAVYSLYRTRVAYAGSAIRVHRASDSAEQDIGFASSLGNAVLDTTSLGTFCGSSTCYVTKWYDQSGHANDQIQTTVANMPIIVNAGTMITLGSAPAVQLGVPSVRSAWMASATGFPLSSNAAIESVFALSSTLVAGSIVSGEASGSHSMFINASFEVQWYPSTADPTPLVGGAVHCFVVTYTNAGKTTAVWRDGASVATGTVSNAPTGAGITIATTNAASPGAYGYGTMGEAIIFSGVPTSADQAIIHSFAQLNWGSP